MIVEVKSPKCYIQPQKDDRFYLGPGIELTGSGNEQGVNKSLFHRFSLKTINIRAHLFFRGIGIINKIGIGEQRELLIMLKVTFSKLIFEG